MNLSVDNVLSEQESMLRDEQLQILTSSLFKHSIKNASQNPNVRLYDSFSHLIPHTVEPFNQHKTGTCWLQAGVTMLSMCSKSKSINFKPSVTFLMFFDKLEKCAVFLQRCLDKNDERVLYHMLDEPLYDGGSWSMFVHLIEKYGVVPFESYPQTFQAKHTAQLNKVLNQYLRKICFQVTENNINVYLSNIHRILMACLACPPTTATFTKSKNGIDFTGSPQELYKRIDVNLKNYICLNHAPNKIMNQKYAIWHSNDFTKLSQHAFHVMDLNTLKSACIQCLKLHIPIWFTANVPGGADFSRSLMECDAIDYELVFGIKDNKNKDYLMNCHFIKPRHAMLIIGVDLQNEKQRWKVQNSWGEKNAFLTMSDEWFDENVFEVAVPISCAPNLDIFSEIIQLPPWDILSTVAL